MLVEPGLIAVLPIPVSVVASDGQLLYTNPASRDVFGPDFADTVGRSATDLIRPWVAQTLADLLAAGRLGETRRLPLEVKLAAGWQILQIDATVIEYPGAGRSLLLTGPTGDFSTTDHLRTRLGEMVRHGVDLLLLLDSSGVIALGPAVPAMLGSGGQLVLGEPLRAYVAPDHQPRFVRMLSRIASTDPGAPRHDDIRFETELTGPDGQRHPFQLTLSDHRSDPAVGGIIVAGHDVRELRAMRDELSRLAYVDALTGLPNRLELMRELKSRLRSRRQISDPQVVLAFIDLDRFKPVNDLLGHSGGDELLVSLGRRLVNTLRDTDLVARLGGDEFVVMAEPTGDDPVEGLCERIRTAIAEPFELSGARVKLSASVGAVLGYPGDSPDTVMAEADAVMYSRKQSQRHARPVTAKAVTERRALAEQLDLAFELQQFMVRYAPVVDLANDTVSAVRLVLQWNHPALGVLGDDAFMPLVEDLGRCTELAELALSQLARDMARVAGSGHQIDVVLHALPALSATPAFADLVTTSLLQHGLSVERLIFEVTEECFVQDGDGLTQLATGIHQLQQAGARLMMGNLPAGSISLPKMVGFPLEHLKIAPDLVANMLQQRASIDVIAAIVGLAGALDIDVMADGVSTHEQASSLLSIGCSQAAGPLYGEPANIEAWLGGRFVDSAQQVGQ